MDFFQQFNEPPARFIECRAPDLVRFTANDIVDQVSWVLWVEERRCQKLCANTDYCDNYSR